MLDRYWHGKTSRISPEAPVPIVRVESNKELPGGAGNVALNVCSLGAAAVLVGSVGEDAMADTLEKALYAAGVVTELLRDAKRPTVTKLRVISHQQQLIRLDFENCDEPCDQVLLFKNFQIHLHGLRSLFYRIIIKARSATHNYLFKKQRG